MNPTQVCRNLFVFTALGAVSGFAFSAGSSSTQFGVSANVASNCLIDATAMSFGTYDPTAGTDNTASSVVSVRCSKNAPVTILLDKGQGVGATDIARTMSLAGNDAMNYGLYSDSGRTANWGTTAGGQGATGAGLATAVNLTVYGKIPKNQYTVGVGNYADTITATVNY